MGEVMAVYTAYNAEMIRRGELLTKMMSELEVAHDDYVSLGAQRPKEAQLDHALRVDRIVIDTMREAGMPPNTALHIRAAACIQHQHDKHPTTNAMFTPQGKMMPKTSHADLVFQVNKALVTAVCDHLITNGEGPEATFVRIDRELRNARIELPGERPSTQKGLTSGAKRLENWRKKANSRRESDEYLVIYERAKDEIQRAAKAIAFDEPVTALAHEELIVCVIGQLAENSSNTPL
jgi:hypothetical protein